MKKHQVNSYFEPTLATLERWNPAIKAADSDDMTFNILGVVGEDYFSEDGTPASKVAAFLADKSGKDITVNINSPGGDFFDGLAIHSMLERHDGNVKIRVLGIAASAASVIAMAGDQIEVAKSAFIMIHNAWTVAIGNKNDMRERADMLDQFDTSMAKLYTDKTGMDEEEITSMMNAETFISGEDAIEFGFADMLLGEDTIEEDQDQVSSLRKVDTALAKAGMPRSKRREIIKDLTGTPSAADPTPSAGNYKDDLRSLIETFKS